MREWFALANMIDAKLSRQLNIAALQQNERDENDVKSFVGFLSNQEHQR